VSGRSVDISRISAGGSGVEEVELRLIQVLGACDRGGRGHHAPAESDSNNAEFLAVLIAAL
jgi:hypothetical protein